MNKTPSLLRALSALVSTVTALAAVLIATSITPSSAQAQVTVYPMPSGAPTNSAFTVTAGGNNIPSYNAYVNGSRAVRTYFDDVLVTNSSGGTILNDGFEGGTTNWSSYELGINGNTNYIHSGTNSVAMYWTTEYAFHDIGHLTNGGVNIWYEDFTNDIVDKTMVQVGNTLMGVLPGQNNYVYSTNGGTNFFTTSIKRTSGWQLYHFDFTSSINARGYINGTQVCTSTAETQFRYIEFGDWWGSHPDNVSVPLFDFSGTNAVPVTLTVNGATPTNVVISPRSLGITPTISGNKISFTIPTPQNLHIEVNGQNRGPYTMELFANPPVTNAPNTNASNVFIENPGTNDLTNDLATLPTGKTLVYFAPGLHIANGTIFSGNPHAYGNVNAATIPSGVTLYIPGGAVVSSPFNIGGNDVTVEGHGIIWRGNTMEGSGGHTLNASISSNGLMQNITNFTVQDITILNSSEYGFQLFQVDNGNIINTHIINAHENDDALDISGTTNFNITDTFIRSLDDNSCIYGGLNPNGANNTNGGANVTYSNCVFLADSASSFKIASAKVGHGTLGTGAIFQNINYINCTAIHLGNYGFYMNIDDSDTASNITYNNCTVENHNSGTAFYLAVSDSGHSGTNATNISGVSFINIALLDGNHYASTINGYSNTHIVSGVGFYNLWSGTNYVSNPAGANITVGSYTTNISFAPLQSGKYTIANAYSGLLMDGLHSGTTNGTPVDQYTSNGTTTQKWIVTKNGNNTNGYYSIVNALSGLSLDDHNWSTNNGTPMWEQGSNGATAQQWNIIPQSNGGFILQNVGGGTVLEDPGSSTNAGTVLDLWQNTNGLNQQWFFDPTN